MKAEIHRFSSLELEDDFAAFHPKDVASFGTWIRMSIGPEGESGSEFFDVFVCTPRWLEGELKKTSAIWARHYLIVDAFNYSGIIERLRIAVDQCSGRDWTELARRLSRIGSWEFEDYKAKA